MVVVTAVVMVFVSFIIRVVSIIFVWVDVRVFRDSVAVRVGMLLGLL